MFLAPQLLKNLRKIYVFRLGRPWGALGGPMGLHGALWPPMGRPWGAYGAPMGRLAPMGRPWGAMGTHGFGKSPGAREYIPKLPINRPKKAAIC